MSEKADLEVVNRTLAAVVQKQEEELKQARADYERLRSRMALWSHAIKMAQDNEREIERLRAALQDPATVHINMLRGTIAKPTLAQIIHLYGDESIRAALTAQPAALATDPGPGASVAS